MQYENAEMATRAVLEGNMKKLDNAHTLLVNHYDDFDKYAKVTPEYTPPKKSDYESKVNLNSWLLDEQGRDMFVVRAGVETQVYHNDPFKKANEYGRELKYSGEREKAQDKHWTDLYVAWSPKGSYLLTFHELGVVVWGGESFEKLGRFPHAHVSQIEFSPNEKYLITSNGVDRAGAGGVGTINPGEPECYIVWDVRAGKKLRGFDKEKGETGAWPAFKWSHDDKYLARKGIDMVSVYETPTMGLLDKKSLKLPGVVECQWSPSANLLAYWVPEKANGPASVAVIELPSRTVKREKHLFNVIDVSTKKNEPYCSTARSLGCWAVTACRCLFLLRAVSDRFVSLSAVLCPSFSPRRSDQAPLARPGRLPVREGRPSQDEEDADDQLRDFPHSPEGYADRDGRARGQRGRLCVGAARTPIRHHPGRRRGNQEQRAHLRRQGKGGEAATIIR